MIIRTTKKFDKQYTKLNQKNKRYFMTKIEIFRNTPFDRQLHNHPLKGKYLGYRSINITGDLRVLYRIDGDMIIIFVIHRQPQPTLLVTRIALMLTKLP